jgi:chromatin remodeling complex protein RSC6
MPKKISTQQQSSSKTASAPAEKLDDHIDLQVPVKEVVTMQVEKQSKSVNKDVEIDSEQEEQEEQRVNIIDSIVLELTDTINTALELVKRSQQELKKLQREIQIERKKNEKEKGKKGNKEKKKRNGSTGLDKKVKVVTQDFRQFIEKNYSVLNDFDGNQIISELNYSDADGSLLITRKIAHKFVNAYVKHNKLQYEDNKRRIKMDKTLQKLFPDNAEKKEKGVVVREEDFKFTSVMKAISSHLASVE